jgi:hypothetical protein
MNESIPSSAHPPQAAQKPRTWFGVSAIGRTGGTPVRAGLGPIIGGEYTRGSPRL